MLGYRESTVTAEGARGLPVLSSTPGSEQPGLACPGCTGAPLAVGVFGGRDRQRCLEGPWAACGRRGPGSWTLRRLKLLKVPDAAARSTRDWLPWGKAGKEDKGRCGRRAEGGGRRREEGGGRRGEEGPGAGAGVRARDPGDPGHVPAHVGRADGRTGASPPPTRVSAPLSPFLRSAPPPALGLISSGLGRRGTGGGAAEAGGCRLL